MFWSTLNIVQSKKFTLTIRIIYFTLLKEGTWKKFLFEKKLITFFNQTWEFRNRGKKYSFSLKRERVPLFVPMRSCDPNIWRSWPLALMFLNVQWTFTTVCGLFKTKKAQKRSVTVKKFQEKSTFRDVGCPKTVQDEQSEKLAKSRAKTKEQLYL